MGGGGRGDCEVVCALSRDVGVLRLGLLGLVRV